MKTMVTNNLIKSAAHHFRKAHLILRRQSLGFAENVVCRLNGGKNRAGGVFSFLQKRYSQTFLIHDKP